MPSSQSNSRNGNKASQAGKGKQSKVQHEVIDLMSDDEHEVIDLITDDESKIQPKAANSRSHLKAKLAAAPKSSGKDLEWAEKFHQEDPTTRRERRKTLNMRKHLAESDSDSNSEAEFASAADDARHKMMKLEGNRLKSMWAQIDEKDDCQGVAEMHREKAAATAQRERNDSNERVMSSAAVDNARGKSRKDQEDQIKAVWAQIDDGDDPRAKAAYKAARASNARGY